MDPKDPKVLVKEAKEFYNRSDFNTAILRCKAALKKDPVNYTALVFQGASFDKLGKAQQSLECYKKAINIDPKPVQAWQGIVAHYEKQGIKSHPDLLDAYKRVATHFEKNDEKKYIENYLKMAHALVSDHEPMSALKVLKRLELTVGLNLEIATVIVSILGTTRSDSRKSDIDKLYTEALEVIVTESVKPTEDTYRKFFSQLYRSGNYEKLASFCLAMRSKWNVYYSPMEWVCRLYLERRLIIPSGKNFTVEIDPIDVVTDKLFKLHPSSTYRFFARGKFLYEERNNVSEAISWIKTGLESSYNLHAVELMINCKLKVGEHLGAYNDCQTAIRKSTESMHTVFRILSVKAQIEIDPEKAQSALDAIKIESEICPSVAVNDDLKRSLVELQAMIHVKKHEFGSLEKLLAQIEISEDDWRMQLFKFLSSQETSPDVVASIRNYVSEPSHNSNFELILEAAELAYHLREYGPAGELYMQAQKTPNGYNHPTPWKYLGHIYVLQEDAESAAKCYKKSYDMIPTPEVGTLLSDAYTAVGQHSQNKEFLTKASKQFRKANSKWVWVRLGLLHLDDGNANEAVVSLQSAIRTDHEDCHIWESLADAYFARGSYTAALNAYKEAIRLGADPIYPKLRIGVVFQALGEYKESVDTLEELLKETSDSPPVCVELAVGYLRIAMRSLKDYLDVSAIQAAEKGIRHAVRAIKLSTNINIQPWLIIGEFSTALGVLPSSTQIKIPTFLTEGEAAEEALSEEKICSVPLKTILQVGTRALVKALNLGNARMASSESTGLVSTIYYQLSLSYYARSKVCQDDKESMLKQSLTCAKKAVSLNENSHVFYNMLGIASHAGGNDKLAQHCFIKSVQIETNNAIAWVNLGIVYFSHKKYRLAHNAFSKAQSIEPILAACWAGQGLVAEVLVPKEAMDLYRHSCQLSLSPLSVIAYADWVCRTITQNKNDRSLDYEYSIIHLDAINVAADLIRKIVGRYPSISSLNAKGILSGLSKLSKESLEAFNEAIQQTTKGDSSISEKEIEIVRSNRISALVSSGYYAEAKFALEQINTLDRISMTNAALTCDKTGDLAGAVDLYQKLSTIAETDEERSHALVAVALVLNRTINVENVKTFLFQSARIARNPYGLLALCTIGLMNNEGNLVTAVLQELSAFEEDKEFVADIGLMRSCASILQGQPRPALIALLRLTKLFPTIAKLRFHLASSILMYHSHYIAPSIPRNFMIQADNLTKISNASIQPSEIRENDSGAETASLIALTYLLENDWSSATIATLKALKQYPSQKDNWAILVYALWLQYRQTKSLEAYGRITKITEEVKGLSPAVRQWMDVFVQKINAQT